jgi:hypothetical protein
MAKNGSRNGRQAEPRTESREVASGGEIAGSRLHAALASLTASRWSRLVGYGSLVVRRSLRKSQI